MSGVTLCIVTGGYNELRFEDKYGEEQVYVQAERKLGPLAKNDRSCRKNHGTI